jgi:hypothetical protein
MNTTPVRGPEPEWVARLRESGLDVRTGSGVLSWEPDDCFSPPPGFRPGVRAGIRTVLRNAWKGSARRFQRLTHSKRHATVP